MALIFHKLQNQVLEESHHNLNGFFLPIFSG